MPLQEARHPADDIIHIVDLIRRSNGWREDRSNQDWLGPWLHHIEDAAKKLRGK